MKKWLLLPRCCLMAAGSCQAEPIKSGSSIESVMSAMEGHGYKETQLEVLHREQIERIIHPHTGESNGAGRLRFWRIGEGTLIVSYLGTDGAVTGLGFRLSDGRPKDERKSFDLTVDSFDPATGTMVVNFGKAEAPK